MKLRLSVLSLFVLVAMVIAACGSATSTPAAPMNDGNSDAMPAATSTAMPGDAMGDHSATAMPGDAMNNDSGTAMPGDAMNNDSGTAMPGDAMNNDSGTAMPGDAMNNDSGTPMPGTDSGNMDTMAAPAWFNAELTDVNTGQTFTIAGLQGKVVLVETMAVWCSNCLQQQKEVKALHQAMGMNEDLVTVVLDVDPNENADVLSAYTAKNGFDWTYTVAPRDVAREIGQLYGDQFLNPTSTPMLIVDRHGQAHPLPFGIKSASTLQDDLTPFLNGGM